MRSKISTVTVLSIFLLSASSFAFNWSDYKKVFLSKDGRIIDFRQEKISHSEGQAYGMLLAVANGDKTSFDSIWKWTKDNLQLRKGDKLFCWSWGRHPNGKWQVLDYNNASDGDILIAWALYLAWKKWADLRYYEECRNVIKSIRQELGIEKNGEILLLPGYYGFLKDDQIVINPSYILLEPFNAFQEIDLSEFWNEVKISSLALLKKIVSDTWSLPPDWVVIKDDGTVEPYKKHLRFGYDAWRVFLYDSWSKTLIFRQAFKNLVSFFKKNGYLPEYVDIKMGCVSLKPGSAGDYASLAAYAEVNGCHKIARQLMKKADEKILYEKKDYFSASLYLLAKTMTFKP